MDSLLCTCKDRQPTRIPQQREYCESQRRWGAQASLGLESLVTAGTGGRIGESRQDRHVAEHGRLGHQVFGRGAAEAADWDAAHGRT